MDAQAVGPAGSTTDDQPAPPDKIQLKIVHGHLAFAKHPVLVGHYNGDTFAGAEAQLDQALGGRLSQRRHLGLYPGPLGTNAVVLDATQRPSGALVVGLGEAASLSLGGLRRTIRQGILALAAAEIDRLRTTNGSASPKLGLDAKLHFSALLVGSGDGGLDRTTCVMALLQAAAEAQSVFKATADLHASLVSLEILELLEHRAFAIWHIVDRLLATQSKLGKRFACDKDVARRKGGRWRVVASRDHGWWQPIQISMTKTEDGQRSLAFAVAGGLARTEVRTIAADLDVVEPLMRSAIENDTLAGVKASPGRALFELLWPASLKDQSAEERNRRLVLDEESAKFPWELLDDRRPWGEDSVLHDGDLQPPAVRFGLVRQLLQTRFQERVVVPTTKPKALIIANPAGAPMPPGFLSLENAEEEAADIRRLLEKTHDVRVLVGAEATPERICKQLVAEAWEIVHISAHGVVKKTLPGPDGVSRPTTGVVLGGGVVLGPSVLSKMPVPPSLFFLNCCHLGRIEPQAEEAAQRGITTGFQPELAASLAVQLIKNGVRAVVAAGWAVDDDVAKEFSKKFYDVMLDGGGFGEAALEARRTAYEMRSDGTTWGAYQCYGEPDYVFPPACRRSHSSRGDKSESNATPFVACVEAIAEVEAIGVDVSIGLERHDLAQQRRRLAAIEDEAKGRNWLGNGELRVALAETYGELGDLPKAMEHYEAARTGNDSLFKVKALEQLANLTARQAAISFRKASPTDRDLKAAVEKIEAARKLISDLVLLLGPTSERLAIVGSCWKRLAQVKAYADGADDALVHMVAAYQQAASAKGPVLATYPPLMVSSARLAASLRAGQSLDAVRAGLAAAAQKAAAEDIEDFWQLIEATDVRMMVAMAAESIGKEDEAEMLQAYVTAWRHVGSPKMLMSVMEQLDFYEDILGSGSASSAAVRSAIVASVRRIRAGLREATGL